MKTFFYSIKDYERPYLAKANVQGFETYFSEQALSTHTAHLSKGYPCISVFTGDDLSEEVLKILYANEVYYIATRAAGYDNIDLEAAARLGIKVANVPEYSPYAIAEHAVAMMLCLDRKLITAHEQVRRHNFTAGNLVGFDLHNKTVGIIGTGRIGGIAARILHGFGCHLLGFDIKHDNELESRYNLSYTNLETLCANSDIITIHAPLNAGTRHLINKEMFAQMKKGVMIINTGRGAVIDTEAMIEALENKTVGYFGMDVYEKEKGIFFFDHSACGMHDPMLQKLISMPGVLVTPHQAFVTKEALTNIAETSFYNIGCWAKYFPSPNELNYAQEGKPVPA